MQDPSPRLPCAFSVHDGARSITNEHCAGNFHELHERLILGSSIRAGSIPAGLSMLVYFGLPLRASFLPDSCGYSVRIRRYARTIGQCRPPDRPHRGSPVRHRNSGGSRERRVTAPSLLLRGASVTFTHGGAVNDQNSRILASEWLSATASPCEFAGASSVCSPYSLNHASPVAGSTLISA